MGHGDEETHKTPKKIETLANEVFVQVTCGSYHTCAITSSGSRVTWGYECQSGHGGTHNISFLPKLPQCLSSKGVISVSAYYGVTACITRAGELFTFGRGSTGRLGHGDWMDQASPKRVEALAGMKVTMVSCSYAHTAVCTEDGDLFTFGDGTDGALGHGNDENKKTC